MRIEIEYTEKGEITSLAGSDPTCNTGRIPRPGHKIMAIDTDQIKDDRDFAGMRKLVESHRVTGHPEEPRLMGK